MMENLGSRRFRGLISFNRKNLICTNMQTLAQETALIASTSMHCQNVRNLMEWIQFVLIPKLNGKSKIRAMTTSDLNFYPQHAKESTNFPLFG